MIISAPISAATMGLQFSNLAVSGNVTVTKRLALTYASSVSASTITARSGNASAPAEVTLDEKSRIGVDNFDIDYLEVGSGALIDAVGDLHVQRLRMLSAGRLSTLSGNVHVSRKIELAPHFLLRCPRSTDFAAAGSGQLGVPPTAAQQSAAVCKWPAETYQYHKWEVHQPAKDCNVDLAVCGADHEADYEAHWMLRDFLRDNYSQALQFECLVKRQGDSYESIFLSTIVNYSAPCV